MNVPATMKVARVARQGQREFEIVDVPTPRPGPGQVLVRVESCGVNFADIKRRRGDVYPFETRFPFVPGSEVAGEVVAIGPGVSGLELGARVFALAGETGNGGYAQFSLCFAPTAIPIPPGISADLAAVVLVAGTTAALVLEQAARLGRGESVLVQAATGGVGSYALQLARNLGAEKVIALVGDESKRRQALALGAHDAVVRSSDSWPDEVRALTGQRGVDVALESTGGTSLEHTLRCLAPFGRVVVYGAASGESASLSPASLQAFLYAPALNQSIAAFNLGAWFTERPTVAAAALAGLLRAIGEGHLKPPMIRALPLIAAAEAHALMESRRVSGKLVIKPWSL